MVSWLYIFRWAKRGGMALALTANTLLVLVCLMSALFTYALSLLRVRLYEKRRLSEACKAAHAKLQSLRPPEAVASGAV